jgi:hypothetical protein
VLPDDVTGRARTLRVDLFSCHVGHYPSAGLQGKVIANSEQRSSIVVTM